MLTPISAYVQQAGGNTVQVVLLDADAHAALQALGFEGVLPTLRAEVGDDLGKARLFAALRDLGVAFSAGREWSPAEVFAWLRDRGLLEGAYLRIAWTHPHQYDVCSDP
ncbi:conserved hypothetical protein [Stenotrophomonas sp. SKA14]|uniref:hypothetical protein n=1 Tax=Stenotrophomonas TaxID=40323 RepID=UPI00018FE7D3|nr:hypothetical protein [Stenotrophomonas sp. SKA14]EED39816.1 conserved hypothetical protein [Stenotrophomonas sp. SKA14]